VGEAPSGKAALPLAGQGVATGDFRCGRESLEGDSPSTPAGPCRASSRDFHGIPPWCVFFSVAVQQRSSARPLPGN